MTDHMLHNLTDLDQGKARHQRTKTLSRMADKLGTKINQVDGFLERLHIFEGNLKTSYEETKDKVQIHADCSVLYFRKEVNIIRK